MAVTISIALQKGGTGKTTTAQALASTLGTMGYRVLLVDMDSQANATSASGEEPERTITDVLAGDCNAIEAVIKCQSYDLLASDMNLVNLESIEDLDTTILRDALEIVYNAYEYIVIDTPPMLGNSLKCCLMASNFVIIPTEPRPFAVNGIDALYATLSEIQAVHRKLKVLGILLIKFSTRTILNRKLSEILAEKAAMLNTTVFSTTIREGVAVGEAQAMGIPLIEYAPRSNPCLDYQNWTNEVLERLGEN